MKITVLIDNIEANNCKSEWGLSFLIEYKGNKYLLDTGSSNNFLYNSCKLGINIKDVDYGILSHAHYDHSDGMDFFFDINNKAKFYVQKSSKENCYSKILFYKKYIGVKKGIFEKYKNRIEYVDNYFKINEGVSLIGHSAPNLSNIGVKEHMYLKCENKFIPDSFKHEQTLIFEIKDGLVILNSCSHGGMMNIISEVKQIYPNNKILAYFGGLHLFNKKNNEVERLAKEINQLDISNIYTGHCTGDKAYKILKNTLKDKISQFKCGFTYTFEDK